MLLWILLMALATCLVAFTQRKNEALNARIQCTMLAVIGVFCAFVLTVSNPFLRNLPAVPSEGRDLNPILQDIGMILHPPVIFAAYAGLAVIFAVIVAVLWQKRMVAPSRFLAQAHRHRDLDLFDCRQCSRFLVGLYRTRLGRLVVLGPGGKRLLYPLAFRRRLAACSDPV